MGVRFPPGAPNGFALIQVSCTTANFFVVPMSFVVQFASMREGFDTTNDYLADAKAQEKAQCTDPKLARLDELMECTRKLAHAMELSEQEQRTPLETSTVAMQRAYDESEELMRDPRVAGTLHTKAHFEEFRRRAPDIAADFLRSEGLSWPIASHGGMLFRKVYIIEPDVDDKDGAFVFALRQDRLFNPFGKHPMSVEQTNRLKANLQAAGDGQLQETDLHFVIETHRNFSYGSAYDTILVAIRPRAS